MSDRSARTNQARYMKHQVTSRIVNFRKPASLRWHLGVVAKRVYRFAQGRCVVHDSQIALRGGADVDPDDTDTRDKDDYPFKPRTDVVLHGSAWAGREVIELIASVEVGPVARGVRVQGDRSVSTVQGDRVTGFSRAAPFVTMPLSHARSYGGFDAHAAAILGDDAAAMIGALGLDVAAASRFTYPRNARGTGFFMALDAHRLLGTPVPNLDDPDDPVLPERLLCSSAERWYEQPISGALDYVQFVDFPRSLFFGVNPELPSPSPSLREVALGAMEEADLVLREVLSAPDARAANGAAPGLARARLRGDEPVLLRHLHGQHAELAFALPGEIPELRIQPPGCPVLELEAALDTIYLEPEHDRVSLIWSGSLEVASRYPAEELAAVQHVVRWP